MREVILDYLKLPHNVSICILIRAANSGRGRIYPANNWTASRKYIGNSGIFWNIMEKYA